MRITIITVCYNAYKTIERTITSVLRQQWDDLEYIIIDGASCDGTVDIVEKYLDDIVFVSEKDNGIYDAMNKGALMATGDIIGFINADDYYEEGVLESVAKCFETSACDIVYGDIMMEYSNKTIYESNKNRSIYSFQEPFPILQPAAFVRSKLIKRHLFDSTYKIAADAKWFWFSYIRNYSFKYIERVISHFSTNGVSSSVYDVTVEWRRAALEAREFEIDRFCYLWRLLNGVLDAKVEELFIQHLKRECTKRVLVVGAGEILHSIIPLLQKAQINIVAFVDDVRKEIRYMSKDYLTKDKTFINEGSFDMIFIATENKSKEIEQEIGRKIDYELMACFSKMFTEVIEEYTGRWEYYGC